MSFFSEINAGWDSFCVTQIFSRINLSDAKSVSDLRTYSRLNRIRPRKWMIH